MAGSFPNKGKASLYPRAISPPTSSRRPHQRVNVPVHQARWHWEHRVPLPYPDDTLPHQLHLDLERIPVLAVAQLHTEEVSRRRRLLTPEQRQNPVYAFDSPAGRFGSRPSTRSSVGVACGGFRLICFQNPPVPISPPSPMIKP
ncbi:hypothetical protein D1007_46807 [Hordeum vulgare]|nr:hypothetical protein D1007_46807 [Hordeum vulgare]